MINIHITLTEEEPGHMRCIFNADTQQPSTLYEVEFAEELTPAVQTIVTAIAHKHGDKSFGDIKPLQMIKRIPKEYQE